MEVERGQEGCYAEMELEAGTRETTERVETEDFCCVLREEALGRL